MSVGQRQIDDLCRALGFAELSSWRGTHERVAVEGFVERRLLSGPLGRLPKDMILYVCTFLPGVNLLTLIVAGAPTVKTTVVCERHSQGCRIEYGPLGCGGFGESVLHGTVIITLGVKLEVKGMGRYGTEGISFVNRDSSLLGKTIYKLKTRRLWTPCNCSDRSYDFDEHRCRTCGRTPVQMCRSVEDLQQRLIRDL